MIVLFLKYLNSHFVLIHQIFHKNIKNFNNLTDFISIQFLKCNFIMFKNNISIHYTVFKALVIISLIYGGLCRCPFTSIHPCVCEKDLFITCGGNTSIDLVQIFDRMDKSLGKTERHFYSFILNNTAITEIKANTTKGITFERIYIKHCSNLTKIDVDAFSETALVTTDLEIGFNERLSSTSFNIRIKF